MHTPRIKLLRKSTNPVHVASADYVMYCRRFSAVAPLTNKKMGRGLDVEYHTHALSKLTPSPLNCSILPRKLTYFEHAPVKPIIRVTQAGDKFDEEGSDGDSETSSGSLVDNLDRNTATPSPFRSMLGGGGSSGALALKDRLRKLGSSTSGGRVQGFGRGNVLRRRKSGSRPRLQHADSISSSEGTKDNSGANGVLGDDMMSPASSNGKGFMSSSREVTTSSDENDYDDENDEEEGLDSPSTGRRGVLGDRDVSKAKHLPTAGKSNPPASQLRNRLLRLTRPRSRRLPAPHLSSSSDSSTTTIIGGEGEERDHQELASSPGRSVAAESAEAGLSLIDNRLTKGKLPSDNAPHGGLGRRVQKGDSHNNRGLPGMTQGAGITTAGSDNRAEPLRERQKRALLSWRGLISGWGRLDETGEHDLAAVSGVGRSAAGRMENAVYGWFGGVIGRAWPGVGLALRPVVGNEKVGYVIKIARRSSGGGME